jgi:hypothetical protein
MTYVSKSFSFSLVHKRSSYSFKTSIQFRSTGTDTRLPNQCPFYSLLLAKNEERQGSSEEAKPLPRTRETILANKTWGMPNGALWEDLPCSQKGFFSPSASGYCHLYVTPRIIIIM